MLALPNDAYPSKLTSAIPTDHGPDVFIYAQERIGGWAREGYLQPLDEVAGSLKDSFAASEPSRLR